MKALIFVPLVLLAACERAPQIVSPPTASIQRGATGLVSENLKPNFNLEVLLHASDDASGFGHVKFRQNNDDATRIDLTVWVRDLAPDTHYKLQRATDGLVDDACTSNSWLTLGEGSTPQDVVTDDKGTATQDLFRVLTTAKDTPFDIKFRVVTAAGAAVLTSECYQFFVR